MIRHSLLLLVLMAFLVACANESASEVGESAAGGSSDVVSTTTEAVGSGNIKIRLPMGFIADPQFAPFYMAIEKGYYADEGFEIEFDYSFETDGISLVGAGELPFAIVSGEQVVLARAQEVPVVYVFEWFQRFPIAVVSKASAGIENPDDLKGRDVGLPGFFGASYVGYAGLLNANGLTQEDVNGSEIGFSQVESLLTDQVDAVVGYANNEPLQLAAQGEDINVMLVADYIDMVANGIITSESLIAENPTMVEAFLRATLRGLTDTLADPAAAFEISRNYVEGLDESRMDVLDASVELWKADVLGLTEHESWQRTQDILLQIGFLDQPLDNLEAAYTNDFVEALTPSR